MRERDESRHLAVGAGAPSDPDPDPDGSSESDGSSEPGGNGHLEAADDATSPEPQSADDVVQAVADFLDDLVDDPSFANDPGQP